MATTGKVKGYLLKVFTGADPGTAITCQTDCSLDIGVNMTDTSCKDTDPGWEAAIPGRKNWSISGSAYFSFDATNGFSQAFAAITADTLTTIHFTTGVTGDKIYSGSGYFEKITLQAGIDDTAQYDYSFKGVGELTEDTV